MRRDGGTAAARAAGAGDEGMTLARKFFDDESGLSRLTWAVLICLAAVLAVRYWAQISGIIDWLKNMGARLAGGAMW